MVLLLIYIKVFSIPEGFSMLDTSDTCFFSTLLYNIGAKCESKSFKFSLYPLHSLDELSQKCNNKICIFI